MTPLEAMQQALATGKTPEGSPMNFFCSVAETVGFHAIAMQKGSATFRLDTKVERHANPMGTIHGGILCDVADAAMGIAYAANLDEGESFTTLELKINYLKPVWNSLLRATARVVKQGQTVGLVECDVTDDKDMLVA